MRIIALALLMIFAFTVANAQRNLSGSRRDAPLVYAYKITGTEAEQLVRYGLQKVNDKHLHTLIDSFSTAGRIPVLPEGNYLLLHVAENILTYQLHTVGDLQVKHINNGYDLGVLLHNRLGEPITQAQVYADNRLLRFHSKNQFFGPSRKKVAKHIKVMYRDVFYVFPVSKNRKRKPQLLRFITRTFPIRYIANPIRRLLYGRDNYRSYYDNKTAHEKKFKGFVVFNKPRYKPGDTVRLKAFVTTSSGKHVNRKLLLRISDKYLYKDTIITTIDPYRPGGFQYEFILNDSLGLELDDDYLVSLEELRSRKYNLDEYYGNLNEEQYALKRKVLIRGKFSYEEYELQSITFSARANKETHHRGEEVAVFMKASDENELGVMDGRVEITVEPEDHQIRFHASEVFIADTFWFHKMNLENVGETKLVIPDSIFPPATLSYRVRLKFLNSNNEAQTKTLYNHFHHESEDINFNLQGDSIKIEYLVGGKSNAATGQLFVLSRQDTLEKRQIPMPAFIHVNPFADAYTVESQGIIKHYSPKQSNAMVSCVAERTNDSVTINILNPNSLPLWYTIFAGNKVIDRGHVDVLQFSERVRSKGHYFVSLQYIYNGRIHKDQYTIPFYEKNLNVRVNQPAFIFPGQSTNIDINVTNTKGEPVAGADVTAFALTKKFSPTAPSVPYLGKIYPDRKTRTAPTFNDLIKLEHQHALNWERWSREMRLDTIEYYKFLHPQQGLYISREPAKNGITQFAPFVVEKGKLLPIYLVYVDEAPVYFSQAEQMHRYSFRVTEGFHTVKLRTRNKLITIDSVSLIKGMKTCFSIHSGAGTGRIKIQPMPDTLTKEEQVLWSKYMILVENIYGESLAYISQENKNYLIPGNSTRGNRSALIGPLSATTATLVVKNDFQQDFEPEGSWQYQITEGLIRQKQTRSPKVFSSYINSTMPQDDFRDAVLTAKEIDSLWQDYLDIRSNTADLFPRAPASRTGNGQLRITVREQRGSTPLFVKNIILFRYDDADFISIYPGARRDLGYVEPGFYRILFLLKNDHYFIKDSVHVQESGINYYEIDKFTWKVRDSISTGITRIIESRSISGRQVPAPGELNQIKERFNDRYLETSTFSNSISGVIVNKEGTPIAHATIVIKGTRTGTTSDANGYFWLSVPERGAVVVSYIGYQTEELRITQGGNYKVELKEQSNRLEEVIVAGYRSQKKRALTGSMVVYDSLIAGRAAGVMIRGTGTVTASTPLIIVDGLPYSGKLEDLDKGLLTNMRVLKGEEATAIYGAAAAGGVVIISTKKETADGAESAISGNSLRRNFRDDAFWQPRLVTNSSGSVSFPVTFPDDITSWSTYVLVMAGKKQSGFAQGVIKSFKTVSGNISLPLFLTAGDSISVIAKSLNYSPDTVMLKRSFSVNNELLNERTIALKNAWIDTFRVSTRAGDSMYFKYTIQKEDGYFDGEERKIPVIKPGSLETNGFFAAFNGDTTIELNLPAATATIKIYAESSVLPVLYDEADYIERYEYLCNEQLASKLKAILVQKKINSHLNKPFTREKYIRELINKLNKNVFPSGLWSWWTEQGESLWISLHVIDALLQADENGFKVPMKKQQVIDYLVYQMESYKGIEKISSLYLLHRLGAKADLKRYLDSLNKPRNDLSRYEQLRLLELRQKLGMPVNLDSLISRQSKTAFGNIYWGEENAHLFNNAFQYTLSMYRMLRNAGGHDALLRKVRNYFLEKRKTGHWRNTYESSLILETILPDLLNETESSAPAALTIRGKDSITVAKFPYSAERKNDGGLSVTKTGGMPVYFTAYQQHWNPAPEKVNGNFTVNSYFEQSGKPSGALMAGTPATLHVKVSVESDAEYVLIEIPIPAGCSYQDKVQPTRNGEVHREYFKNKVSIFCKRLPKGSYAFQVSLLPRYSGLYTLNPAKAEVMYFPVFNGREALKKVRIE
jgi:alpha-2-macroglobulin